MNGDCRAEKKKTFSPPLHRQFFILFTPKCGKLTTNINGEESRENVTGMCGVREMETSALQASTKTQ